MEYILSHIDTIAMLLGGLFGGVICMFIIILLMVIAEILNKLR